MVKIVIATELCMSQLIVKLTPNSVYSNKNCLLVENVIYYIGF